MVDWQLLFAGMTAVGTVGACLIALFGEALKRALFHPKLRLSLLADGLLPPVKRKRRDGRIAHYVLFRLLNSNRTPATNCRVMLRRVERRGPDGRFHGDDLAIPHQLTWSPSEMPPLTRTVVTDETLDFGYLTNQIDGETAGGFVPQFYIQVRGQDYSVRANECVRYHLQVVADNFASTSWQIFEVAWDGTFADEVFCLQAHFKVNEVKLSQRRE